MRNACGRAFAEQPAGLAVPYARKTPLLAGQLRAVAAALAGRAGSRLARAVLAVEVSRHTLVRVLMALPEPAAGLVRVLGIDDFSLRKGQAYATLLVDMETGRPVDVLPDREQATVEEWLRAHPGTEVICRDRGGAYAAAVRAAAPGAVQVADRWHVWHNLCEYAGKAVARHRECAGPGSCACQGRPQDQRQEDQQHQQEEEQQQEEGEGVPAGLEAVVRERHRAVHELRAAGKTQDEAAAALGLSRQLAGRFWRAASAEALLKTRGASALDPYKPYLRRRWDQGATSIAALHREITALGYAGSEPTTYAWLALLKLAAPPSRPPRPRPARSAGGCSPTPPASAKTSRHSSLRPSAAAPSCTSWPGTSPSSPRCSPAAPAAASTAGSPLRRAPRPRLVRQRHPPGLPGRPQRPGPGMELRPGRGPQHPDQATPPPDVRPRQLPAPAQAHPDHLKHSTVTTQRYEPEPCAD